MKRTNKERRRGPAVATLVCWVIAYLWLGWPGVIIAVLSGTVMSIGTLVNRGAFDD